jgi:hypothetical protein
MRKSKSSFLIYDFREHISRCRISIPNTLYIYRNKRFKKTETVIIKQKAADISLEKGFIYR